MAIQRLNFAGRLLLFTTSLLCLSLGLSSAVVYRQSKIELERSLGSELLAIATSTAALIDADLVDLIYRREDGQVELIEEFELLRDQLDQVRASSGLPMRGNPIYIMRATPDFERTGELEFVVMPDRNDEGEYFVGNLYQAEEHNRAALRDMPARPASTRTTRGRGSPPRRPFAIAKGARWGCSRSIARWASTTKRPAVARSVSSGVRWSV